MTSVRHSDLIRVELLAQQEWWVPLNGWASLLHLSLKHPQLTLAQRLELLADDEKIQVRAMDRPWRVNTASMLRRMIDQLWEAKQRQAGDEGIEADAGMTDREAALTWLDHQKLIRALET